MMKHVWIGLVIGSRQPKGGKVIAFWDGDAEESIEDCVEKRGKAGLGALFGVQKALVTKAKEKKMNVKEVWLVDRE